MAWRRPFGDRAAASGTVTEGQVEQISNGSVQYIGEKGGNDAPPTYQDASGAPVENNSPLGYSVGPVTITLLNITMMIGAGIYSTRASSLRALRSSQGIADISKLLQFSRALVPLVSVLSIGLLVT
ncbi:High-affinity methionine permease, partial [Colletotrichum sp. SAR 10_75]